MKRELELQRRLRSLALLGEAVGAMKNLSAHHFRESRGAVEPARCYREGVARMLGGAGAMFGSGDGPAGLLIVGGEFGLCGSYNARLVEAAIECRAALGAGPTWCVGRRAALLLERHGLVPDRAYDGPAGVAGITPLLLELAEELLNRYVSQRLSRVEIVSTRFGGVGSSEPERVRLLPPGRESADAVPAPRYVSAADLASAVVREHLYISLYGLLLDALAAEHGARLLATQSAEQWLDEQRVRVGRLLTATRREAGTQEMIEIAAGARARRDGTDREAARTMAP